MAKDTRPVIGLLGGIGSGKSTVARLLREMGCVVADSDMHARESLRDPAIRRQIVQWWGDDVLDENGAVDRSEVAAIVFRDPEQRHRLEGLIHPWVESRRREQFAAAPAAAPALVIDAPLILEAGVDRECDGLIFVDAPPQTRLRRVRASRGWDEAEIARREESQLPLDAKRNRADHIVSNDGDLEHLRRQVRQTLSTLLQHHREQPGDRSRPAAREPQD